MAGSKEHERNAGQPTLRGFLGAVAAELVAVAIVGLQGLAVGLFGSGPHHGSPVLIVFVGALPIVAAFTIAVNLPVPAFLVFGVAAAVLATSVVVLIVQLFGGLPSGEAALVKFAVAAYGSYVVCLYLWSFSVMRNAGKYGMEGWKLVYAQAWHLGKELGFRLAGGNPGAVQHPEGAANEPRAESS